MSLLVIAPVFSEDGELEFYNPDDTKKTQQWVKQGGEVGIRLTDADLDVPIKHVLLPADMVGVKFSTSTKVKVEAGTKVITVTGGEEFEVEGLDTGDTVLVGRSDPNQTVRKISSVEMTSKLANGNNTIKITVTEDFDHNYGSDTYESRDSETYGFHKVTATINDGKPLADDCPTCAMAQRVTNVVEGGKDYLENHPIVNTDITYESRFKKPEKVDSLINEEDVLILDIDDKRVSSTSTKESPEIGVDDLNSDGRFDLENDELIDANGAYALYWGNVENTTREMVTAKSNKSSTAISVLLTETEKDSGIFEGKLATQKESSESAEKLTVGTDDIIKVEYKDPDDDDQTASIDVETTPTDIHRLYS